MVVFLVCLLSDDTVQLHFISKSVELTKSLSFQGIQDYQLKFKVHVIKHEKKNVNVTIVLELGVHIHRIHCIHVLPKLFITYKC